MVENEVWEEVDLVQEVAELRKRIKALESDMSLLILYTQDMGKSVDLLQRLVGKLCMFHLKPGKKKDGDKCASPMYG